MCMWFRQQDAACASFSSATQQRDGIDRQTQRFSGLGIVALVSINDTIPRPNVITVPININLCLLKNTLFKPIKSMLYIHFFSNFVNILCNLVYKACLVLLWYLLIPFSKSGYLHFLSKQQTKLKG